ncbi:MAG: hypothetical protein HYS13_03315, partial [Planctomycetia bacterium]|nr:hypothetical protein [Planctomycetia bacterium]
MQRLTQLSSFAVNVTAMAVAAMLVSFLAAAPSRAADPVVSWLTGPELEKRLESKVGISWERVPLRDGLLNLARKQAVCVFIDRRVDPVRRVDVAITGPLQSVFQAIAQEHNAQHAAGDARVGPAQTVAVTRVGAVVYFGPEGIAKKLRTAAELRKQEVADQPLSARQPLGRVRAWRWDEGTSPRELVVQLADESGVAILGTGALPH